MTYSPCSIVAVHADPEWRAWSAHPALQHWIWGYWEQVVREGTHTVRTLPDACVDITCDLSRTESPVVYVAGPQTEPATHAIVAPTRLFGARLHPLAATRLIGPRLDRLTNGWEPLERFIGKTAVDLGKRMASVDVAEATSVFDSFFSEYLIGYVADRRLTAGVTAIFASQGCATVAELACAAATTERTLRRIFKQQVGLTPKCFARIVRLQAVIRRLETQPDWAQLAADFGYADQSHLIREMHALFGDTPSAIRGRRLAPK